MRPSRSSKKNEKPSLVVKDYEDILANQNQCCLCGTELQFTHKVDYAQLLISEEAFCPKCSIRTKNNKHILQ